MDRIDITLNLSLPQDLAEQAEAAGLLTEEQIEGWVMRELERRRQLAQLKAMEPPITPEEIEAEIEAYRREKRQRKSAENP